MIDASRVRRTVVGLRPFRRDGFRVAAGRLGGKLLVHNYGHGGSGVTLSWGTARLAAELAMAAQPRTADVIGCGVVGLSTARMLQSRGVAVTIHAAGLPPHITSNVAGAFWGPVAVCDPAHMSAAFALQLADALRESRRAFDALAGDARYGVRALPLYHVDREPPQLSPVMAVAPELFEGPRLAPGEHPFGDRHALVMRGLVIDTTRYIAALYEDFLAAGGSVAVGVLTDITMVAGLPAPVVVNCAGLGARILVGDTTVVPVKGQLLLLDPQPEVGYIVIAPRDAVYMLPREDALVLGTSKEPGTWTLDANPAESARIMAGVQALCAGRHPRTSGCLLDGSLTVL